MDDNSFKKEDFLLLQTRRDLATFLNIKYSQLVYHIYKTPEEAKYKIIKLNKKSGGTREICAPISPIKIIQKNINKVLNDIYETKVGVHGFTRNRSIVSNAEVHTKRKLVLNIDLENFFNTINFGRVRGRFMSYPFNFNNEVATTLAQICCYNGYLPQGAPTSPILTNFICQKLDNELLQLCIKNRCVYSRYADDITFSTNKEEFGEDLYIHEFDSLGKGVENIILNNGFKINEKKITLRNCKERQIVTGLTVNNFPNVSRNYIRRVRAMLHAWQKFGLESASFEHFEKYDLKNRNPLLSQARFEHILNGMISFIGHVKTKESNVYKKLSKQLKALHPHARLPISSEIEIIEVQANIYVEGKTDYKHLKNALAKLQSKGRFNGLEIKFHEPDGEDTMGSSFLYDFCRKHPKVKSHTVKDICIFDRDEDKYVKEMQPDNEQFKHWGKGIYSFCLPIPSHRDEDSKISIEQYYTDEEIKTYDENGRRLYISSEFNTKSSRHLENKMIICRTLKPKANHEYIIDDGVFDENDNNIALTKNDFAENIFNKKDSFKDFDIEEFSKVFDVITQILKQIV